MRAHDDEIASGLLRGLDDSLRGVLVLDMAGLASCTRLVGGPFDAFEDGGRVSCSGLLINLDHGWSWQSRVRPHGSVTVTTVTWAANDLASASPWANALALA